MGRPRRKEDMGKPRLRYPRGNVVAIVTDPVGAITYHSLPSGASDVTIDWLRESLRELGCDLRVEKLDTRGTVEVIAGDQYKARRSREEADHVG